MENEESSSLIGNSAAPYINGLANSYGLATQSYAIYAFDASDGTQLWSQTMPAVSQAYPTICDGRVYVGSYNSQSLLYSGSREDERFWT